jgi:hypothetical protein
MDIKEIRAKFPQYGDISDGDLVQALHKKYYSDIPYQQFEQKVFKTTPVKLGQEGMADSIAKTSEGFSGSEKFMVGAAGAVNSAAMRLKQLTGRDLTPEDIKGLEEYKALEKASGAAVAGDIAMNVLATIQPGALLYGAGKAAAEKVLPQAVAKWVAPTAGAAVSGAGITAATQPTMEGETGLGNAVKGGAFSVAANTLTRGAARAVQPIVQSEPVKKLMGEGVVPTPGQAAGGWVNRMEQRLESVWGIGDIIKYARNRATKELDEAAIRKALPQGTAEEIKAGKAGIERAGEIVDEAYDTAYKQITGKVKPDTGFFRGLQDIPKQEGIDLPPSLAERFDSLVKDRVVSKLAGEGGDAEAVRAAQNSLGALARKYRASADPDQRALGQAFAEAKSKLRELVSRQADPEFKGTLDALDKNYSALLAVEKAAGYQGSREGVFTAEALKRASKKSTTEVRNLAETGTDVLGNTVPDSGTAGRLITYALGGSIATGNERFGGPEWVTAAAMAPLLYNRPVSKYMVGGYGPQATIAEMIRGASPYTSQLGRSIGNQ